MSASQCIVCGCEVPNERLEFLIENNREICCTKHAQPVKLKAIYSGEHGTSELIFCDRIYNDSVSVRTKLYNSEDFEELEDEEPEEEKPSYE